MAKKYYQDMKKMEKYAGYDSRRSMEYRDSMMISEDRSAIANMPQEVKYVEYPKEAYYKGPYLNDTMRGIDAQVKADLSSKSFKRNASPEKY